MNARNPVLRLHGAFEVENFGDILLARIFADWARECGWQPMVVDAPDYVKRDLGLIEESRPVKPQALLLFGGGYLGEPKRTLPGRWRWGFNMIKRHLSVLDWARRNRLPYAVIGAGFGPISNLPARWMTRSLLGASIPVVLRDEESAALARQYGVNVSAVSADAALTLADQPLRPEAVTEANRIRSLAQGRPVVAVQFDQPEGTDESWTLLHATLADCLKSTDYFVFGVSDQRGTAVAEKHKQAAEEFLRRLGQRHFEPYTSMDGLIGKLSAADLVVTSKLHLGIVASSLGKPVVSVPTHQKTVRFYRQLGRSEICVPKAQWTQDALKAAFSHAEQTMGQSLVVPEAVLRAARSNQVALKSFLQSVT